MTPTQDFNGTGKGVTNQFSDTEVFYRVGAVLVVLISVFVSESVSVNTPLPLYLSKPVCSHFNIELSNANIDRKFRGKRCDVGSSLL